MMIRRDMMNEIDALQRNINSLFGGFFPAGRERQAGSDAMWTPPVNSYEDKESFVLTCDLPGMEQKDVKINLDKDILTVAGTRKLDRENEKEKYLSVESAFGTFSRSFTLPPTVAIDKIEAKMEKGVLTIRLPKKEESKPKQISIKSH